MTTTAKQNTSSSTSPANRQAVIEALRKFINQRSGIDWRNYGGNREAFMGDYRPIIKHGKHARELLRAVELRPSITAETIIETALTTYAGRLQLLTTRDGSGVFVEYTTGQYFPTEYRKAACAVLSQVLWQYWRAENPEATWKDLQKWARRELGRSIATTWFN